MYTESQVAYITRLEKKHRAEDFVQKFFTPANLTLKQRSLAPLQGPVHYIEGFNNQFFDSLFEMLELSSFDEFLRAFRSLVPSTYSEELFSFLNDDELLALYNGVHLHLNHSYKDIVASVHERLGTEGAITKNDKMQFSGKVTKRSLAALRDNPIEVELETDAQLISKAESDIRPISELNKNERIFTINGFRNSKLSLIVHDLVDHLWFFDTLEFCKMFDKYDILFKGLGNPEKCDIFKREGELVASIAYGIRLFNTIEQGFRPKYLFDNILSRTVDHFKNYYSHKHKVSDALRIILQTDPQSRTAQSLSFVFSNLISELDEQKRKHGIIWFRVNENRCREFDPFDEQYLSFFIEAHNELILPKNKHRNLLFAAQLIVEDWLVRLCKGERKPLNISFDTIKNFDYSSIDVNPETILWIKDNYGYLATRRKIF
jgi:hypothetical protein